MSDDLNKEISNIGMTGTEVRMVVGDILSGIKRGDLSLREAEISIQSIEAATGRMQVHINARKSQMDLMRIMLQCKKEGIEFGEILKVSKEAFENGEITA